jgi:lipopolysaccharide transport system permease protein
MSAAPANYEIIIERSRGWMRVNWRELWEYRDLLVLLVQRDFISRYKQTLLGPVWFIVQPLLTTAVFVIIFGRVAGIPTDGIPGPLFYLGGLLAWNYFAQNITTGSATFVNNAGLFGKVWFPRLIVPVATVVSNLVAFALQLIPFALLLTYFEFFTTRGGSIEITPAILLLPLPLLQVALLSLGVSLWMAASTAKYRDLIHLNQYIVQIWMFATPIIYPLSKVSPQWKWIVWTNPMSVPTEAFRWCLLGRGTLTATDVVISVAITIAVLVSGIAVYQKVERTVVDAV